MFNQAFQLKKQQSGQYYDYDIQNQVRELKINHRDVLPSQDIDEELHDNPENFRLENCSQLTQQFSEQKERQISYYEEVQRQAREKKYQAEVAKRLIQCTKQLALNGTIMLNNTNTINQPKQDLNQTKLIVRHYDTPAPVPKKLNKFNKRYMVNETMQQLIEARQIGKSFKKECTTKVQQQESKFVITDKKTLFSMLPSRKTKANNRQIEEEELSQPIINKNVSQRDNLKQATQECNLQSLNVRVTEVKVFGPFLVCCGYDLDKSQQIKFVLKPGFHTQIQRQDLYETNLDFDYATKPEEGKKYTIQYRTINIQGQYMVEKLDIL